MSASDNLICPPNGAQIARPYTGPIDVEFVTLNVPAVTGFVSRDLLVQFQRPWKMIGISSIGNEANGVSMFLHFVPLGLDVVSVSNTIIPTGKERWFPFANPAANSGHCEGRYFKFAREVKQFYIDADHAFGVEGAGYFVTFFGTNEMDFLLMERT